jgi:hypothetical protein
MKPFPRNWFRVIILSKQYLADQHTGETSGSHGGSEDDDVVLVGCDAV